MVTPGEGQPASGGSQPGVACFEGATRQPEYTLAFPQCAALQSNHVRATPPRLGVTMWGARSPAVVFLHGYGVPAICIARLLLCGLHGRVGIAAGGDRPAGQTWASVPQLRDQCLEPGFGPSWGPTDSSTTSRFEDCGEIRASPLRWGHRWRRPRHHSTVTPARRRIFQWRLTGPGRCPSCRFSGTSVTWHHVDCGESGPYVHVQRASYSVRRNPDSERRNRQFRRPMRRDITVGSAPPVPVILNADRRHRVLAGARYFSYQGAATDPDEGALPEAALKWTILLHHNTHVHTTVSCTNRVHGISRNGNSTGPGPSPMNII